MKVGRAHVIPLSTAALAVLENIAMLRMTADADAYIFPGAEPASLSIKWRC
jgi:hypothetical protein